ncbi:MAG TPA: hypothetical protein PLI22_01910 [Caldisericia bacterium]|nr:hypothetical protein [Caldisericia bacterium]
MRFKIFLEEHKINMKDKKVINIVNHIKTLLNFDISPFITYTKKNHFNIDCSKIPYNVRVNIKRIGYQYGKYRTEDNGVSGMAIIYKK